MTQLSPAAEAIWKAFNDAAERVGVFEDYGDALAAALRAAVDQVVPQEPRPDHSQGFARLCIWNHRVATRCQFLFIADELEGRG